MAQLPKLELIACFGVGVDAVDLPAAKARNIAVTNTPDVLTDDVADLAIGLMVATLRRIPQADRYVREGKWLKGTMPLHQKVSGRRLGIVGMGRIGQAIARRAAAFDMAIAYNGPSKKNVPYRYEPDLVALAREVDVLIAACRGVRRPRASSTARCSTRSAPKARLSTSRAAPWSTNWRWSRP